MTSSRLDRLFVLLESGSSSATRNAAARQLGEVQRLHPHELHALLSRVATLLRSPTWETRVAAAEAVRAVLATLPPWKCNEPQETREDLLTFNGLDLKTVLSNSSHLMGSEGQEYDLQEDENTDIKDKLAGQRKALCNRLGLDGAMGMEIAKELFTTEDLVAAASISTNGNDNRRPVTETLSAGALSSREMNRIRRKSRLLTKQRTEEEPPGKKIKMEDKQLNGDDPTCNAPVPMAGSHEWSSESSSWPLTWFSDQLSQQLFSGSWESRHGAATAFRELAVTCGKSVPAAMLEDLAVRLVCVLALDRFGDFVGDAVVAPVRETGAQALGAVLCLLDHDIVLQAAKSLIHLTRHEHEWQARHGALLGLRYALAVPNTSWTSELLPLAYEPIVEALSDPVEDVSAAAASALLPVASQMCSTLEKSRMIELVKKLWGLLGEQDELAAACNSHMALLAALLRDCPDAANVDGTHMSRLWPFMGHGTTAVRRAALQTLSALADAGEGEIKWEPILLQEALRRVYERALVEHIPDVRKLSEKVWGTLITRADLTSLLHAACPLISNWLCLSMQPQKLAFDQVVLSTCPGGKLYIGGGETVPLNQREVNAVEARCSAARMLGLLSKYIVKPAPGVLYTPEMDSPVDCYVKVLMVHLQSRSALQRTQIGLVVSEWAKLDSERTCPQVLTETLHQCLSGPRVYWDEIASSYTRLLQEAKDFTAMLKHYNLPTIESSDILTLEQLEQLGKTELAGTKLKPKVLTSLEERRRGIAQGAASTAAEMNTLSIRTLAALAGAVVKFRCLPQSLNPIIRPLMEAVKREKEIPLQELAAENLAHLVEQCVTREPNPNGKIVSNLSTFLRCDPDTPKISIDGKEDNYNHIVMLVKQQKQAEKGSSRGRGPGRPPIDAPPLEEIQVEDENLQIQKVQKRGASLALQRITSHLGEKLPETLPRLWELIIGEINKIQFPQRNNNQVADELLGLLQILETCLPAIHENLLTQLMNLALPKLFALLMNVYSAIRHMSARCLAALALLDQLKVMELIVEKVLPLLGAVDCEAIRQGAVETISCVVEVLQFKVVPYVVLLVVPLMGRMSDQNSHVRLASTHSFAQLVQLLPLDGGVPEPPNLAKSSIGSQREKDRAFLAQLLHPASIPDYVVPIKIQASLRSYQQAGVNWLAFLNKYKLHGILCDDMGLGKTLQSICILAGDHHLREQQYKLTKTPDCAPLPSLVICPPTLTGHWCYEVEKFLPQKQLKPLQYAGTPAEREKLRREFNKHNLIVASYDIVRKDITFFQSIKWNYCILDEGHVIKNGRTRTSIAIKQLTANHRLILSGTPIQNNVLELWSLFDFLMPGFLGTEKQFTARYSRPILASRDPKSSAREQELGALAMESLHRQVLPFLLRRMKEDVLNDLPPKITQDYYCELSALQVKLYEDFAREAGNNLEGPHVFQALRYLQNVCNHPKLVLTQAHPQYEKLRNETQVPLDDISHAAKLPALKQLLSDCGIGFNDEPVCSTHRALVFCQLKAMLDIVENDLLRKHMPNVAYLRLDGSIPPTQRHDIVRRFNSDPSIDVLLLTTQVGGLGLNLTGADTVIFVEHDWNPMRDLQAMDRAHRIGQKRVVNVYRLITRGTLEEKIMGLQKFKVQTANTVISGENSRLETMGTEGLLELFGNAGGSISGGRNSSGSNSNPGSSVKALLESLPELWDPGQYDEEYDISTFVQKLKTAQS